MRAAFYERKGPPLEVLRVGEVAEPLPGPGDVRVRIAVSGVNPSDTKARGGWGGDLAMEFPLVIPHNDGAGTIDRVGPGVPDARVGERVWVYEAQKEGRAFGTAAELVVVPARNAVPLPPGITFDVGAALGVPAMTAHRALMMDGPIAGQTVLVTGAAGAVGDAAVRLAKWFGAAVIATVNRPYQVAAALAAGADHAIDRHAADVTGQVRLLTGGTGVDRIVEVAFEENLAIGLAVLKANGVIATYASGPADSAPALPFYKALMQGLTVHFDFVYLMPAEAHAAAARDITAALAAGALAPRIGRRFALADIAAAHVAQDDGTAGGKVLVDVAG